MNTLRLGAATAVAALACTMTPADAADAADAAGTAVQAQQAPRTTTVVFDVPDCEGCTLQLEQGTRVDGDVRAWHSKERKVSHGTVRFTVPSHRTWGTAVLVRTPWEGHQGYTTTVAMRYAGQQPGDELTLAEARDQDSASACWAGTRRDRVHLPVTVEKIRVGGVHREVWGSIAYATRTQDWENPMREAWDGVLGSQDWNICR